MFTTFTNFTMSDTKSVIELLCKHLSCTTEVPMKPDFFRLAKYNKSSPEAVGFFYILFSFRLCYCKYKTSIIFN